MAQPERFPDVMLLAAGLGQRMQPLTSTRPKPLIEVAGVALIDRVIAAARHEGAQRFAVNAHHLADQIIAHFAGCPDIIVLREERLLGTGGGVRNALSVLSGDPFLVMNTDSVWRQGSDRPIGRMRARFGQGDIDAVLLCAHPGRATGFSRSHDFCLDPSGLITLDYGLPVIYAGVALMARTLFDVAPDGPFSINHILEPLQAADRVGGVLLNADWHHVGDAPGLAAAQGPLS